MYSQAHHILSGTKPEHGATRQHQQAKSLQQGSSISNAGISSAIAASSQVKQFISMQHMANNSQQAFQMKAYQAMADSSRKTNNHQPVQLLRSETLPEQDYGTGFSAEAYRMRIRDGIHPKQNIATFHFTKRPNLEGEAPSEHNFSTTKPSTGVGMYVQVSNKTQAEKKINASHSEHGLIHGELAEMRDQKQFPQEYIIDWVYTERPACPDVWYGQKFIAKGCNTELKNIEEVQKTRLWDVGQDGTEPFGLRPDLEITVLSTFDSAAEIKEAAFFATARIDAVNRLRDQLIVAMQNQYAQSGTNEEYDLMEYDDQIPKMARSMANDLPSWSDYDFPMTKQGFGGFQEALQEEAAEILGRIK